MIVLAIALTVLAFYAFVVGIFTLCFFATGDDLLDAFLSGLVGALVLFGAVAILAGLAALLCLVWSAVPA